MQRLDHSWLPHKLELLMGCELVIRLFSQAMMKDEKSWGLLEVQFPQLYVLRGVNDLGEDSCKQAAGSLTAVRRRGGTADTIREKPASWANPEAACEKRYFLFNK